MNLNYLCGNHYEAKSPNMHIPEVETTVNRWEDRTTQAKYHSLKLKYQVGKRQVIKQASVCEAKIADEVKGQG